MPRFVLMPEEGLLHIARQIMLQRTSTTELAEMSDEELEKRGLAIALSYWASEDGALLLELCQTALLESLEPELADAVGELVKQAKEAE